MLDDSKDKPLVSVIVIAYNSSIHILETLESVRNQTYNNLELIVSDDCSIDNTVDLCRKWLDENESRFIRTLLITTANNTGIPANCNRGVHASQGRWVKLIAGDDVLTESCIAKNVSYINKNKEVEVLFSFVREYNTIFSEDNFILRIPRTLPVVMNREAPKQYRYLLLSGGIHYTPSSFISKEVFERVAFFDEKYPFIEDYPFWLNITKAGVRLHFMEEETVKYRRHQSSIHNITDNVIVKPSFFRNIQFIRDYIYPNIAWYHRFDMKYKYLINKFTYNCFNKRTKLNNMMHRLLIKYLNPFTYIKMICVR